MKQVLSVAGVLLLIAVAIFGCLLIFGVMSIDAVLGNMLKIVAAIILLSICWGLVGLLMNRKD